jgi:hypothetical protein
MFNINITFVALFNLNITFVAMFNLNITFVALFNLTLTFVALIFWEVGKVKCLSCALSQVGLVPSL